MICTVPLIGKLDFKDNGFKYGWDKCKSYTYGLVNSKNVKVGIISKFYDVENWNKELILENTEFG